MAPPGRPGRPLGLLLATLGPLLGGPSWGALEVPRNLVPIYCIDISYTMMYRYDKQYTSSQSLTCTCVSDTEIDSQRLIIKTISSKGWLKTYCVIVHNVQQHCALTYDLKRTWYEASSICLSDNKTQDKTCMRFFTYL